MIPGSLRERLARVPGMDRLPSLDGAPGLGDLSEFDATNDLHIDAAARYLLERFREHEDVDAFQLLFELTHDRLLEAGGRIARQLGHGADAEDLVAGFMARLFCDVGRRRHLEVRRFLGLAHTSMRNDLLDQLRRDKRATARRQQYHETLDPPATPAVLLQRTEDARQVERAGKALLQITAECFEQLEERDRQVLVAREILRLPYDRVAGLLDLAPDQVGMIIRRARKHLLDRIMVDLSTGTAGADDPGEAADLALLQRTVAGKLNAKQRTKSVKVLLERMLAISTSAARRKLADLLYELAKACLTSRPTFAERTLDRAEPRRPGEVRDDLRQIAGRLDRVHGNARDSGRQTRAVADLPGDTGAETALDDARLCLERLESIEGPSGRQRVALALVHIHDGRPEKGHDILMDLQQHADQYELSLVTRQNVSRNITLALLRQERYAEALTAAEDAAATWPDDPVRVMNVCYAAARLGKVRRFEEHAARLAALNAAEPSTRVQGWIDGPLRDLAHDMGLSSRRIESLIRSDRAPAVEEPA